MAQAYQTVELANGTWSVFSLVTGEQVSVVGTKADAVALVGVMNRQHNQVMDAFASLLVRNGNNRDAGASR